MVKKTFREVREDPAPAAAWLGGVRVRQTEPERQREEDAEKFRTELAVDIWRTKVEKHRVLCGQGLRHGLLTLR